MLSSFFKPALTLLLAASFILPGAANADQVLKLGICPGPYGKMLTETIEPILKEQGVSLEIIEFTDYLQPDLALDSGDLDANLMQHTAYLNGLVENQGLNLKAITTVPTLGMGAFSEKIKSFAELPQGAKIAIPMEAVNLGRTLRFLSENGLITLEGDLANDNKASVGDVAENPHDIEFILIEAAQISRSLDSVDVGCVPGNYAIAANLDYSRALAVENVQPNILNVVATRAENQDTVGKLFFDAVRSDAFRKNINDNHYFDAFTRPDWY